MEEKIKNIIENNEELKNCYNDNNICFRPIIDSILSNNSNSEDTRLELLLYIIMNQSKIYSVVLNNISLYGTEELIAKCKSDINNLLYINDN